MVRRTVPRRSDISQAWRADPSVRGLDLQTLFEKLVTIPREGRFDIPAIVAVAECCCDICSPQ
jgi:hypothetical protein